MASSLAIPTDPLTRAGCAGWDAMVALIFWVVTGDEQPDLPNILKSRSANAAVLRGHLALYRAIMFGESGLTRAEREALGFTVSNANDCYY